MIWRYMCWFLGFGIILYLLGAEIHPVLGLLLFFVAACAMLPMCIRFREGV